jgi:hypothetical protein
MVFTGGTSACDGIHGEVTSNDPARRGPLVPSLPVVQTSTCLTGTIRSRRSRRSLEASSTRMRSASTLARALSRPALRGFQHGQATLSTASHVNELIEEERVPCYRPELFHPTRIGDILQDRYRIITKLGYGTSSTVWLAEDQSRWAIICWVPRRFNF